MAVIKTKFHTSQTGIIHGVSLDFSPLAQQLDDISTFIDSNPGASIECVKGLVNEALNLKFDESDTRDGD